MTDEREYQWLGRALVTLLKKSRVDGPTRFLTVLQEISTPGLTLEVINSLRDCGVLITIAEREKQEERRKSLTKNAEKARLAKQQLTGRKKNNGEMG